MKINKDDFVKSTFSGGSNCVGVSIKPDKVSIINTKTADSVIDFTKDEWIAFIKGTKNGEFDILES